MPGRGMMRGGAGRATVARLLCLSLILGFWAIPPLAAAQTADPAAGATLADAAIRVVHAATDTPAVDLIVDGRPAATAIAFGSATEQLTLAGGEHQIRVVAAAAPGAALADATFEVEGGQAVLFVLGGRANDLQFHAYPVNLDAIGTPRQARIRLIHALPGADPVALAVAGGETLIAEVGYATASGTTELDTGRYDLELRQSADETVLLAAPATEIAAGQVYDLIALGQGARIQLLSLVTSVSTPCGQTLRIGDAGQSCLRFVHTSPDAGAVDLYLDGDPVVRGLTFGVITNFAATAAGEHQIQVVAAGGAVDAAVIDETATFAAGQAYQVAAVGLLAGMAARINEINLTPLPANQARLRVINAAPDLPGIDIAVADGPTLFVDVAYGEATDYAVVDAGTIDLHILVEGASRALEAPGTTVRSGVVYDIFTIGQQSNGSLTLLLVTATATPRQGATTLVSATPVAISATPAAATPMAATPAP
ncbi:MAG: DUF4397 domain-containing protein [Chloroflexota bacterium]|nr:DUF4397 domain-containing protein [Chloroflexota bacterium]